MKKFIYEYREKLDRFAADFPGQSCPKQVIIFADNLIDAENTLKKMFAEKNRIEIVCFCPKLMYS